METIYIVLIIVSILMFVGITINGTSSMLYKKTLKENIDKTSSISKSASDLSKQELQKSNVNAQVIRIPGNDNAYYDYQNKMVALSDNIYTSYSAVAQAIAMHEVGHAIQDSTKSHKFSTYKKYNLASKILTPLFWISIIVGFILVFAVPYEYLYSYIAFGVGGITLLLQTIFKLLTFSMEKEASDFGIKIMKENDVSEDDITIVKSIYSIALTTYFASLFKPMIDLFNGITWLIYNTIGRLWR